jgi:hypothetical protein
MPEGPTDRDNRVHENSVTATFDAIGDWASNRFWFFHLPERGCGPSDLGLVIGYSVPRAALRLPWAFGLGPVRGGGAVSSCRIGNALSRSGIGPNDVNSLTPHRSGVMDRGAFIGENRAFPPFFLPGRRRIWLVRANKLVRM